MPSATKLASDILHYWYYMTKYREATTMVSQRYVLEIEMAQFMTEATHPPVIRLLSAFMDKEKRLLGIIPNDIA